MLWQHRQVAHDLRQFAIAFLVEAEFDLPIVHCDGLGHILEVAVVSGLFFFSTLNDQIMSSTVIGCAVMPFGARVEPVGGGGKISQDI